MLAIVRLTELPTLREDSIKKKNLLSTNPPVLSNNSGATESSERVAAVTLSLENCSCSQATYSRSTVSLSGLKNNILRINLYRKFLSSAITLLSSSLY